MCRKEVVYVLYEVKMERLILISSFYCNWPFWFTDRQSLETKGSESYGIEHSTEFLKHYTEVKISNTILKTTWIDLRDHYYWS